MSARSSAAESLLKQKSFDRRILNPSWSKIRRLMLLSLRPRRSNSIAFSQRHLKNHSQRGIPGRRLLHHHHRNHRNQLRPLPSHPLKPVIRCWSFRSSWRLLLWRRKLRFRFCCATNVARHWGVRRCTRCRKTAKPARKAQRPAGQANAADRTDGRKPVRSNGPQKSASSPKKKPQQSSRKKRRP